VLLRWTFPPKQFAWPAQKAESTGSSPTDQKNCRSRFQRDRREAAFLFLSLLALSGQNNSVADVALGSKSRHQNSTMATD
jgi:hypothetical protein